MSGWCRSCGAGGQAVDARTCSSCGASLQPPTLPRTPVGLAFTVPGRLKVTKRLAICVHADEQTAVLHASPKDKDTYSVELSSLSEPSPVIPTHLSPPARLLYATRQPEGAIKESWDEDVLLERVGATAGVSIGAMRQLANEALTLGWDDIVDWCALTPSERAWRRAHEAAAYADLPTMAANLAALPERGYDDRVSLVLPYVDAIGADPATWVPLVARWREAGIPNSDVVLAMISDDWFDGLTASAAVIRAADPTRASAWLDARDLLASGTPGTPIAPVPTWAAAATYVRGRSGQDVRGDFAAISALAPPLLDDLIEAGTIDESVPLHLAPMAHQPYLLARLRPGELPDDEAAALGHDVELARRYFVRRDRTHLFALAESPGVSHFHALLDVVDGKEPDTARLEPASVEILGLATRCLSALADGATSSLPRPILNDPTLWAMFAEHARSGRLAPDAAGRAELPLFAQWCDLQRLVGLLWDLNWPAAADLGRRLADSLDEERFQDEALSLTAFALGQMGLIDEALGLLEKAMTGSYSEALLVNTSIMAAQASPEIAAQHLARVVREAPTTELQVAAMRRAIQVYLDGASASFPTVLTEPLRTVLQVPVSVEDFDMFATIAASHAPHILAEVPDPGGEQSGILLIQRARAKFLTPQGDPVELANAFLEAHRRFGRTEWFNSAWAPWVQTVRDLAFEKLGESIAAANFIDTVIKDTPDLFERADRFVLSALAGGHLAVMFGEQGTTLNDQAFVKFFFRPIEEFLADRDAIEPGLQKILAGEMARCLFVASNEYLRVSRGRQAEPYNALVQRLGWDSENRGSIRQQMRNILQGDAECQEQADRMLDRLRRIAPYTEDSQKLADIIAEALQDWRQETIRLRGNL